MKSNALKCWNLSATSMAVIPSALYAIFLCTTMFASVSEGFSLAVPRVLWSGPAPWSISTSVSDQDYSCTQRECVSFAGTFRDSEEHGCRLAGRFTAIHASLHTNKVDNRQLRSR